jgi:hypothetical protein
MYQVVRLFSLANEKELAEVWIFEKPQLSRYSVAE